MRFRTEPRKLPVVFSAEEVFEILRVAPRPGLKYRAALSISYGTGYPRKRKRIFRDEGLPWTLVDHSDVETLGGNVGKK